MHHRLEEIEIFPLLDDFFFHRFIGVKSTKFEDFSDLCQNLIMILITDNDNSDIQV